MDGQQLTVTHHLHNIAKDAAVWVRDDASHPALETECPTGYVVDEFLLRRDKSRTSPGLGDNHRTWGQPAPEGAPQLSPP